MMSYEYGDNLAEEKVINEEYKIWKKNTPFLYDLMFACALDSPSLTVQFQPTVIDYERHGYRDHYLLLGTQNGEGESNYLVNARLRLPRCDAKCANDSLPSDAPQDYGVFRAGEERLDMSYQRIPHEGEVNRARSMPQQQSLVATRGPKNDVTIYNLDTQPKVPGRDAVANPDIRLEGHTREGYGLAWNTKREGFLASGAEDGAVCVWDVRASPTNGNTITPLFQAPAHHSLVGYGPQATFAIGYYNPVSVSNWRRWIQDIAWSPLHDDVIASVGDDGMFNFWDLRTGSQQIGCKAHDREITCVAFNPFEDFLLATGSVDRTVALWDMRYLKARLHTCMAHSDEVFQIHWSPHNSTILGSSGADRRVMVWDMSRIGMRLNEDEANDGPPELLFIHGGHTSKVSDFSWNPSEPWVIGSVADNNILQVWQMADSIYTEPANEPAPATNDPVYMPYVPTSQPIAASEETASSTPSQVADQDHAEPISATQPPANAPPSPPSSAFIPAPPPDDDTKPSIPSSPPADTPASPSHERPQTPTVDTKPTVTDIALPGTETISETKTETQMETKTETQ